MIDAKTEAIALIKEMPSDSTIEDIMGELYFKAQVDAGLKQLDKGDFIPHDDIKQRVSQWLSK
ncbi:MAG: hypothetical protein HW421_1928 [Ignavibacteria bacterium]|nr:hypothetical protein [Ignavibacteria bacterium]